MRERLHKVVKVKNLFVLAGLLVALQPLYGVFVAPNAAALSGVDYTVQPLSSGAWRPDRTVPSGGYGLETYAGRTSLRMGIDNNSAASDGFYRTEGVKRLVGEADVIKADLYIDGNWTVNDKNIRAGLWGVGRTSGGEISAYPIVEFVRKSDFTGWRMWNSVGAGSWQNLSAGFATDAWSSLTLMRNKVDQTLTDVYINGVMVGQSVADETEYYSDIILNNYNYATGDIEDNYNVHWSSIQTGEYTLGVDYVLPTALKNQFRPNDNVARLKINDEMQQFNRVQFRVYDAVTNAYQGVYNVNRSQCSPQAGYIICDIKSASNWGDLTSGTYYVKLTAYATWSSTAVITTDMSDYWSGIFTIDTSKPVVNDFVLESPVNGYTNGSLSVAALASDNNMVESVNFYVTAPRVDGECTGNGAKLVQKRVAAADIDGKYRATFDVSGFADGNYCVTARARDHAKHNSVQKHTNIVVDKTAPTLQIQTPNKNAVFGGSDQINVTSYLEDKWGLSNYFININSAGVSTLSGPEKAEEKSEPEAKTVEPSAVGLTVKTIYNAADFANGEYVITVRVTDKAGNATEDNRTIFIDHSVVTPLPGMGVVTPLTKEEVDEASSELTQLAQRLTQPFSVPRSFVGVAGNTQANQEVLGFGGDEDEVASGEKTVAAAPSEEGWKIFGVAWYWWLLLASILGVVTSWIMRRRGV